ncbi:hypothetical protein ES703_106616 [subsurface metagenome]
MPRRKFTRKSGFKDSKLIVLACEGQKTEIKYFEGIKNKKLYDSSRIHIEILQRKSSASAPEYVLEQLDHFKKDFILNQNDELWLVMDRDRWGVKKISNINSLCGQKNYNLSCTY